MASRTDVPHHSITPTFHHSIVPLFHHSNGLPPVWLWPKAALREEGIRLLGVPARRCLRGTVDLARPILSEDPGVQWSRFPVEGSAAGWVTGSLGLEPSNGLNA